MPDPFEVSKVLNEAAVRLGMGLVEWSWGQEVDGAQEVTLWLQPLAAEPDASDEAVLQLQAHAFGEGT